MVELFKISLPEESLNGFKKNFLKDVHQGLEAHEIEVRECVDAIATRWHKDETLKLLAILSTIEGEETDFIDPRYYKDESPEKQIQDSEYERLDQIKSDKHCKLPKENFNIFLGTHFIKALNELREKFPQTTFKNPPILVHKAPGTPDRVIFLARFKVPNIIEIIKNLKAQQASN